MSTTAASTTAAAGTRTVATAPRRTVWKHGLGIAALASVATTALAALASAAGVSFAGPTGESIPLLGFAQLTFVFSMLGVGMAAVMARTARRPRSTFVRTTVVLTALSCVPDVTFGFDVVSALTLIALHVVAAVIVIPVLAKRLADVR